MPTSTTAVDFSYSRYTGTIPTEFGSLVDATIMDLSGNAIGMAHRNPMLDTQEYKIELKDGTVDKMLAN